MKKVGIVVAALLCVALVCSGFYLAKNHAETHSGENVQLTKVQKIIMRDLENDYPATPREVVKFYNQIITVYYGEDYTDEEFSSLVLQARQVMDKELLENNPETDYKEAVRKDVANYKERSRTIRQTSVCDTNEVLYLTDKNNGDELAYVTASYFVQEKKKFDKTYQKYVLRKDDEGNWKILNYYQIEGSPSEEDDD
ncbi:MAG: hypothetical protein PUA77_05405 [Lachnospiraceae bacterium]|nr:hypothetical protein [Agathobacter sp.]MDD6291211.1 hypothetical protein [Lachnospiraceae bacterium]